jgi:hypothetical protein
MNAWAAQADQQNQIYDERTLSLHWALTHQLFGTLKAPASLSIDSLKDIVAKYAKVPPNYLGLIIGEQDLDSAYVWHGRTWTWKVLADVCTEEATTVLVAKRMPDDLDLLHLIRSKIRGFGNIGFATTKDRDDAEEAVQYLMMNRTGLNAKDSLWYPRQRGEAFRNCTTLHYAAIGGFASICKSLLDAEDFTQSQAICSVPFHIRFDYTMAVLHGCTALHCAAARFDFDTLIVFLKHPRIAAVNAVTEDGWTALHTAVDLGSKEAIKLLVEDGRIPVDAATNDGRTCMDIALSNERHYSERHHEEWYFQEVNERHYSEIIMCLVAHNPTSKAAHEALAYSIERKAMNAGDDLDPLAQGFDDAKYDRAKSRGKNISKKQQQHERSKKQHEERHKQRQARYRKGIQRQEDRSIESRATAGRALLARALSFSLAP